MAFLKHVGRHGDRKVAIVFRQVPGEEHMALVVYPEVLPAIYHDAVMRVLESASGQNAEQLADELFRNMLPDGRNILHTLHTDGMIKKVQAEAIIVTPNATSSVRLDELNRLINEMKGGSDAAQKLADLDKGAGLQSPGINRQEQNTINNALDDTALAKSQLAQAEKMLREAEGLKAEATRLKKEALKLDPSLKKASANESTVA